MTSLGYLQYSEINDNSAINEKKQKHNTTIKKRHDGGVYGSGMNNGINNGTNNGENVQTMLKLINNSNGYENDDDGGLADFNPPPRAEVQTKAGPETGANAEPITGPFAMPSSPVQIDYEKPITVNQQPIQQSPVNEQATAVKPRQYPAPLDSYEGFNALPKTYATDYYKQYVPYFNQSTNVVDTSQINNKNQLLEKLNYMIHLLEEQKDEKTGHVMEEVILYSFLGVFIIFIVDSFARVGKYTR